MSKILNIALVAHDSRKKELLEWVKFNIKELCKHNLYATGTTGKLVQKIIDENGIYKRNIIKSHCYPSTMNVNPFDYKIEGIVQDKIIEEPVKITCLLSGPLGGDQMIGAMIAQGQIDVLIFFCDNLITQGHQQDISALSRLASLYNTAFATNRTTADMLITSPLFDDEKYNRIIPSAVENYANRKL